MKIEFNEDGTLKIPVLDHKIFSNEVVSEIKRLLRKRRSSKTKNQKKYLAKQIRDLGFMISHYSPDREFTSIDFERLIKKKKIIIDDDRYERIQKKKNN